MLAGVGPLLAEDCCCRRALATVPPLPPRRSGPPRQPACDGPYRLRAQSIRSASGSVRLSRLPLHSLALRPGDSLTILPMAWSMGSRGSVSLRPAIQVTGRLALAPADLLPPQHLTLFHTR